VTCGVEPEEHRSNEEGSESGVENEETVENEDEDDNTGRSKASSLDPIRWFGVLVPPPLRSAQVHFIKVVEGSVPHLVVLTKQLRALEIEIGRTRKSIKKLEKV
jgi:coiled-coil domain-containing protein 115